MSLDRAQIAHAQRLSLWEGFAWAVMVGLGESYFIADAVRLRASALQLALTITLPLALAGAGPLAALVLLRAGLSRKRFVVPAVLGQAGVLLVLSGLEWLGAMSPMRLIALVCLYQITGQGAGTAWSSWFGDLVPAEVRGRYFSRRNRGIYVGTFLGLVTAGAILQGLEPKIAQTAGVVGGRGFALAFLIAAVVRICSAVLLSATPEPTFSGLARRDQVLRYVGSARGSRGLRLIAVVALFHFAVYLSSPYYGPFMLETLQFTYLQYTSATLLVILIKSLVSPLWGAAVDRRGARLVWSLALLAIALVPLPWVFARGVLLVMAAQAMSGAAWSAFELGYFAMLLEAGTKSTRPVLFALQSVAVGWSQLAGGIVAAMWLPHVTHGYRDLFAISSVARLIAAGIGIALIRRAPYTTAPGMRRFAMRFLGLRASGGLARRPIFDSVEDPDED